MTIQFARNNRSRESGLRLRVYEFMFYSVGTLRDDQSEMNPVYEDMTIVAVSDGDRPYRFVNSQVVMPAQGISDSGIATGTSDSSLTINMPDNTDLSALLTPFMTSNPIRVFVTDMFMCPTKQASGEAVASYPALEDLGGFPYMTSWAGFVSSASRAKPGMLKLVCTSAISRLEATGLRLAWGRNCPYTLFDQATCKVEEDPHRVFGRIVSVDPSGFNYAGIYPTQVPSSKYLSPGWFTAGMVKWGHRFWRGEEHSGIKALRMLEQRGVQSSDGQRIEVQGGTAGMSVGDKVILLPGCSRSAQECHVKFNNLENCGGVPGIPRDDLYSVSLT